MFFLSKISSKASDPKTSAHGPSFLRWAGSKRKSLALLAQAYPSAEAAYIEPFAGSAALFFSLRPKGGTLADLNGHLINALRQVRSDPVVVHRRLIRIPRNARAYYSSREKFNETRPFGPEAAALFIYLNRNCFNGLWRTNSEGLFNVPYGGTEMGDNPPLQLLRECSGALRNVKLLHQDFRKTIEDAAPGSFIYADPPYFTSTQRTFVEYGKKSFGEDDLRDLIAALVRASKQGTTVALTYNDAMPIAGIPRSWTRTRFEVTRNVGGFAGSRKKQSEILYTSRPLRKEAWK